MTREPGVVFLVAMGKADDPALRSSAREIDARRDDPLLGGVYLCYGPLLVRRQAELARAFPDKLSCWRPRARLEEP
jgi:hypothetical protein